MEAQGVDPYDLPLFKDMPELEEWLRPVWNMFHSLNASRQFGYGSPQPLQMQEISASFNLHEIHDPDDREAYLNLIQFMDRIALEVWAAQRPPTKK